MTARLRALLHRAALLLSAAYFWTSQVAAEPKCPKAIHVMIAPKVGSLALSQAVLGWLKPSEQPISVDVGSTAHQRARFSSACPKEYHTLAWIYPQRNGGVLVLTRNNHPSAPLATRELDVSPPIGELDGERVAQALAGLISAHQAGTAPLSSPSSVRERLALEGPTETAAPLPVPPSPRADNDSLGDSRSEQDAGFVAVGADGSPTSELAPLLGYAFRPRGDEPLAHGPLLGATWKPTTRVGVHLVYHYWLPTSENIDELTLRVRGSSLQVGADIWPISAPISLNAGAALEWPSVNVTGLDPGLTASGDDAATRSSLYANLCARLTFDPVAVAACGGARLMLRQTTYSITVDGVRDVVLQASRLQPELGLHVLMPFNAQ